jgi:hypothetical protein
MYIILSHSPMQKIFHGLWISSVKGNAPVTQICKPFSSGCCLFLLELCLCLIIQKESHNVWQFAEANDGKDKYTIRRHSIFYLSIITWLLHCCPSLWRLCKQNAALLHLWCCIASVVSYLLYHQLTEQEYVLQSNLFPISLSELFTPLWIKDWGWRESRWWSSGFANCWEWILPGELYRFHFPTS